MMSVKEVPTVGWTRGSVAASILFVTQRQRDEMAARRWRKMTWALVVWCALIVLFAVAGGVSAGGDCARQHGDQFLTRHAAQSACDAGAGIGVIAVLGLGFFGFVFLSLIWLMSRPRHAS